MTAPHIVDAAHACQLPDNALSLLSFWSLMGAIAAADPNAALLAGWRRCISTCGRRASRPASASLGCPGRCGRQCAVQRQYQYMLDLQTECVWPAPRCDMLNSRDMASIGRCAVERAGRKQAKCTPCGADHICGVQVLPFPQYELQARWVARVLSGRVSLPSPAQMEVCHAATASTRTAATY